MGYIRGKYGVYQGEGFGNGSRMVLGEESVNLVLGGSWDEPE